MDFIIGGSYQGKCAYAVKWKAYGEACRIVDGEVCDWDIPKDTVILNHFHVYIKRMLHIGKKREDIINHIDDVVKYNHDLIIISNEIGYGIVPMDAVERLYREEVGRICCELAARAEHVIRVTCGIGTFIK